MNRNKRSVCLDLKTDAALADLLGLVGSADVLVENFRVGVMDRLGLSYEMLHARFPRLVYASIRGFGDPRTGASPYADWPAFDIIAQAMGAIMGVTGPDAEHPVKVGPGVGDVVPAMLSAFGILAAVRHAEHTGEGQLVDVAMYDAVLALTERIVYQYSITGHSPAPMGNTHPLLAPYGAVRTANGYLAIAAPSDGHWRELAEVLGHPQLGRDPRFATNAARLTHAAEVYRLVAEWTTQHTTAEAVAVLAGRVPCAPVQTAADIAADPHVTARELIVSVPHPGGGEIDVVGTAIKLTATPVAGFGRAPLLGEHNAELLGLGSKVPGQLLGGLVVGHRRDDVAGGRTRVHGPRGVLPPVRVDRVGRLDPHVEVGIEVVHHRPCQGRDITVVEAHRAIASHRSDPPPRNGVPDPERVAGVVERGAHGGIAHRRREHLPSRAAGHQQLRGQCGVQCEQRGGVADGQRAFDLGVDRRGPRIEVARRLRPAAGAAVAGDQHPDPRRGARQLDTQLGGCRRGRV